MAIEEIKPDIESIGYGDNHLNNVDIINRNFNELSGGGSGLTNDELRAEPVKVDMVAGHMRRLPEALPNHATISTANQWQQLIAQDVNRVQLSVYNASEENDLYVTMWEPTGLTAGAAGTYKVRPSGTFYAPNNNAIWIMSPAAGTNVTCGYSVDEPTP